MSDVYTASGRRRTAVASVSLKAGSGKIEVNKREFNDYFPTTTLQTAVLRPLELAGRKQDVDITLKTSGGGVVGQASPFRGLCSSSTPICDLNLRRTVF